jgi:hypothetical protein
MADGGNAALFGGAEQQYADGDGDAGGYDDGNQNEYEQNDASAPAADDAGGDGGGDGENTWDTLPAFATAAHRALFAQIKAEKARLGKLHEAAAENAERVAIMADHLKNVQQELAHTQALCDSKIRETETEDHIRQLAEREAGKVVSDYQKADKDMQNMQDKVR